ncbi:MAG: acyl-CoA dehydrogenase family protein [Nocardioidaceae bacterium]|nr:acyl-CoA dehydrogenase family protein [Nocardioidaceae bacterium]
MDFTYDSEQKALRDAVRGLLTKAYDSARRRDVVSDEPGFDSGVWAQLAEMGVLGLPFAEADGGMGAGPVEVGLVAEEIGRVLAPEPFVEAVVVAGGLVADLGTAEQKAAILAPLSDGTLIPVLAHTEPGGRWEPVARAVTAREDAGTWRLTGTKEPVAHGARADLLVVSAATPAGTGLFVVDPTVDGVTRTGYALHDGGRAAQVVLDGAVGTPLGAADVDRTGDLEVAQARAIIIRGQEAVGAMQVALDTTTAYLTTRKQFGVTLNKFQALTFRAADMYVSLELARSIASWALLVLDSGADPREAAARTGFQIGRAGHHIGQEAIQLHGGIAMTAEYSVGHYMSHLTALEHALGDRRFHLGRLAASVGDHGTVDPLA